MPPLTGLEMVWVADSTKISHLRCLGFCAGMEPHFCPGVTGKVRCFHGQETPGGSTGALHAFGGALAERQHRKRRRYADCIPRARKQSLKVQNLKSQGLGCLLKVEGCWLKVRRSAKCRPRPLTLTLSPDGGEGIGRGEVCAIVFPGHMTRSGSVVGLGQIFDMGRSKKPGVRSQKPKVERLGAVAGCRLKVTGYCLRGLRFIEGIRLNPTGSHQSKSGKWESGRRASTVEAERRPRYRLGPNVGLGRTSTWLWGVVPSRSGE